MNVNVFTLEEVVSALKLAFTIPKKPSYPITYPCGCVGITTDRDCLGEIVTPPGVRQKVEDGILSNRPSDPER